MSNTPDGPDGSASDRSSIQRRAGKVRRFRSVLATAAFLLAALDTLANENEPSGFRGMPWGTPLAAVQSQMTLLKPGKYVKIAESLSFAGVQLQQIQYEFKDGRFEGVELYARPGLGEGTRLRVALQAQFGKPSIVKDELTTFWVGDTSRVGWFCAREGQCVAFIIPQPSNNTAVGKKSQEDLLMARYHECRTHCTSMYIICNTGSRESYGTWVPPALRCDDNLAICESDCDGELHRRQYEISRAR